MSDFSDAAWASESLDVGAGGVDNPFFEATDTRLVSGAPGVVYISNPEALQELFDDSGDVGRWLRDKMEEAKQLAYNFAPVDSGDLRDSIDFQIDKYADGQREAILYVDVEYGAFQEVGTVVNPPHPYLRPAIMQVFGEFEE